MWRRPWCAPTWAGSRPRGGWHEHHHPPPGALLHGGRGARRPALRRAGGPRGHPGRARQGGAAERGAAGVPTAGAGTHHPPGRRRNRQVPRRRDRPWAGSHSPAPRVGRAGAPGAEGGGAMTLTVFLGTHQPSWLGRYAVPMFISRRRLAERKSMPRALTPWALDSGGFTELMLHGRWTLSPEAYVAEVRRYAGEVGQLRWAAIQDWMCEPWILKKTGLSVGDHQFRTVANYERLLELAPELPWAPVLQGWEPGDYHRHLDMYASRGHDLRRLPIVGLGSVCRRQHTAEAELLIRELTRGGLRLHGFGFKVQGLARVWDVLSSSDSLAWSFQARRS